MTHAERCPLCGGSGQIVAYSGSAMESIPMECNGCSGTGWVTVRDLKDLNQPIFKTKPLREIEDEQGTDDRTSAESSE